MKWNRKRMSVALLLVLLVAMLAVPLVAQAAPPGVTLSIAGTTNVTGYLYGTVTDNANNQQVWSGLIATYQPRRGNNRAFQRAVSLPRGKYTVTVEVTACGCAQTRTVTASRRYNSVWMRYVACW